MATEPNSNSNLSVEPTAWCSNYKPESVTRLNTHPWQRDREQRAWPLAAPGNALLGQ
jgi:hypothetical protein